MVVCSIATSTINTTIEWSTPLHNSHIDSLHSITQDGLDTAYSTLHDGLRHCYIHHYHSITWGGLDTSYSTSHDGLLHCYIHHNHSVTLGCSDTAYTTLLFVNTNIRMKDVMQDSPDNPFLFSPFGSNLVSRSASFSCVLIYDVYHSSLVDPSLTK